MAQRAPAAKINSQLLASLWSKGDGSGAGGATPTNDLALTAIATQDAVIVELTRILNERDAEINLITQHNLSMESYIQEQQRQMIKLKKGPEAYNTLMALYMERNEELRVATHVNLPINKDVKGLEDIVSDLKSEKDRDETVFQIAEMAKKVVILEEEGKSQREAMSVAEEAIVKKDELIEQLEQEKEVFAKKVSEDAAKKLTDKINVLSESEKRVDDLMEEKERLIEELKKGTHAMESKDVLNNAQRQRIEELETLLNTYEKRFLAKDVDVPKRTFDLF
jgi:ABC-type Fe3+/spermidine/putrescine transport system ATPase subunit